jgi:DNA-binding NtrC family response regulator
VRELKNALIQAVILSSGEVLEKEHILLEEHRNADVNPRDLSLAAIEKEHIKYVLDKVNWDKKKAAKILGISRQTLYAKIHHYFISPG